MKKVILTQQNLNGTLTLDSIMEIGLVKTQKQAKELIAEYTQQRGSYYLLDVPSVVKKVKRYKSELPFVCFSIKETNGITKYYCLVDC